MPHDAKTENEMLRQRLSWAEGELHRIDMEAAHMAIARREELAAEEAAKQLAAQRAAEAVALEQHRRDAWLNFRIDQCHEAKNPNDAFVALMSRDPYSDIPESVWPPNDGPENYRASVAAVPTVADPKIETTRLGALLKDRLGVKI